MDFPMNLTVKPVWVYGREELKQNILLLCRNHTKMWIQSATIGAKFDVHCADGPLVEEGVRATLEQVPYIKVLKVVANLPLVDVHIEYNGETINFQYSMEV